MLRLPDSTIKVFVEGRRRVKIRRFIENERFFQVEAELLDDIVNERSGSPGAGARPKRGI